MAGSASAILRSLNEHGVRYVLIDGAALELHGSAYVTQDVDIVYQRAPANVERLVRALAPYGPRLRVFGEPDGLAMVWDARTIMNGGNFTLITSLGDLDILATVAPGWKFEDLVDRYAARYDIDGLIVDMLTLEGILETKKAAGRAKDYLAIPEIEAMIEAQAQLHASAPKDHPAGEHPTGEG